MGCCDKTAIQGAEGGLATVTNGNLDVQLSDQHTHIVGAFAMRVQGTFTLAAPTTLDDNDFTVSPGHGINIGDFFVIKEDDNYYQCMAINVVGDVISTCSPFDTVFTTSAICERGDINMAVDGSSTRQVFELSPPPNTVWDITQISGYIQDDTNMSSEKFAGISALQYGIVFRDRDDRPHYKNHAVIKANWNLQIISDIFVYDEKAPATKYSLHFKRRIAGQQNVGVTIRVYGNHNGKIEFLVQDDLTGVEQIYLRVIGHVVE